MKTWHLPSVCWREKSGRMKRVTKKTKNSIPDSKQLYTKSKKVEQEKSTKKNVSVCQTTSSSGSKQTQNHVKKLTDVAAVPRISVPTRPEDFSANWKKMQSLLQPKGKSSKAPPRKKTKLETSHKKDTNAEGENANKDPSEEIWFDDVDEILIEKKPAVYDASQNLKQTQGHNPLVFPNGLTGSTKAVAMDCEMVGVGKEGQESVLARVSLVNQHGNCIYDKFVKAREKVTDFRTHVSGVRPQNLKEGQEFHVVQKEVSDLLQGRILVGHAIHNDLKVLFLDHPRRDIRDTSRYKPFRLLMGGRTPSLKKLTAKLLGVAVQEGEHNSVQDAQAAMRLYTMYRKRWEQELKKWQRHTKTKPKLKKKKEKTVTFSL